MKISVSPAQLCEIVGLSSQFQPAEASLPELLAWFERQAEDAWKSALEDVRNPEASPILACFENPKQAAIEAEDASRQKMWMVGERTQQIKAALGLLPIEIG